MRDQRAAGIRQHHAPPRTLEENGLELGLQRAHLQPDRGLRQRHAISCRGKRAALSNDQKGLQKPDGAHAYVSFR